MYKYNLLLALVMTGSAVGKASSYAPKMLSESSYSLFLSNIVANPDYHHNQPIKNLMYHYLRTVQAKRDSYLRRYYLGFFVTASILSYKSSNRPLISLCIQFAMLATGAMGIALDVEYMVLQGDKVITRLEKIIKALERRPVVVMKI